MIFSETIKKLEGLLMKILMFIRFFFFFLKTDLYTYHTKIQEKGFMLIKVTIVKLLAKITKKY